MIRLVYDISTGDNYYVSEVFEEFVKEHFSELYDGKTLIVHFEGMPKMVFMTNDLKIQIRNHKEATE